MKKSFTLFAFLCSLFSFLHAQELAPSGSPLAGTYIIGSNQTGTNTFKTITAAVTEINNSGVSGPVVFLLNDTNYSTGETFPIKINQFQGTSTVNTLTIKPNTGKAVTITGTNINGYTALPSVFQIDGGDNIIIDGSNLSNGNSRDLTIVNNDNVPYAARTTVWISSNAANGATNIKVLNLKLQMTNRNQDALQLSGIFSGSNGREGTNGLSSTPATAANSNFTVKNNEFLKVRQGIIVNGNTSASLQTSNVEFSSNKLGSAVDVEKPLSPLSFKNIKTLNIIDNNINGVLNNSQGNSVFTGIEIENSSSFAIKRNTLTGMKMTLNNLTAYGIRISGLSTDGVVSENKISDLKNTGTGRLRAIQLDLSSNTTGFLLANNFISDVAVNTNSSDDSDNAAHGIYITNGNGIRIYHNTVAMNSSPAGWSSAIYFAGGIAFDVQNNIFTNTLQTTTGKNYTIYSAVGAGAFLKINNNNYFSKSSAYAFLGGDRSNITAWKAATGKDDGSLEISPVYVSTTDLHLQTIAANVGLANAGFNLLSAVPTDIDGQARTSTPEIGADEFAVILAQEPTAQSTALKFTDVTANSFKLDWTKGAGTGTNSIVVIRSGSAVNSPPLDATVYNANAVFGSGSQIGTGNYVVYGGTENTVTVTGLSAATTYYVSVYEYNGDGATANYLPTNPLTGNQKTLNATLGWQISNNNTLNPITFDSTVSGVNNGSFVGNGFAPAPIAGQLDSNSWSINGFEDGAIAFGGINTNPDFGRGISTGGVSEGGIYAVKTSVNNAALGIQPSANDFTPGTVTLRFQNQTSSPINSISIGYKVYVYNDQETSNSFNFSHSADNTNFTGISELDVASPATAEVIPSWKASYRVATISGLNIPANGFYYLKWSGAELAAGSDYDEFALDDIVLSANPSNVFADFNGTAENFSVHGNTGLSGNLTVNGDLKLTAGKLSVNANTLTLGGTVINTIAGGISGSASSNITIINNGNKTLSFDQTTVGSTNLFNNFSVPYAASVTKTVSVDNPFAVNGALNVGLDQTLDLKQNALGGNLSTITINGTVLTQNTSATPFPANKTWAGTGILHLNSTLTAQKLVTGTYTNLRLSSTGGTIANTAVTVNGILDLPSANPSATAGSLSMVNESVLTMGPSGTNTGLGDVTGIIKRDLFVTNKLYTFGHPNTSITFPPAGTLPNSMSIKLTIGAAPSWRTGAVKRSVDIIQSGGSGTKAIIRQHYLDSELPGGKSESKLVFWINRAALQTPTFEQGRSSNNITDNWVEITNANVGLFFTNTFGNVFITLDETAGTATTTWKGFSSTSWTTGENWTNGKPSESTQALIPNATTTNYDPELNASETIGSLLIEDGGIVNSTDTDVLILTGAGGAWQNFGTFNPGTASTITFKNLDATIVGSTTFNSINIPVGGGIRPAEGNYMSISGTLTNNGTMFTTLIPNTIEFIGTGQIIPNVNGLDFGGYHNLIVSGTETSLATSPTLNIRGNLTLNNPLSFAGKTVNLAGVSNQTIGGTAVINFNDLTVNKETGAVILAKDVTVGGTLTLTKGNVILGTSNLSLGQNPVAGNFGTNTMIVADGAGFVRRPYSGIGSYFFPIGELTSNPAYSPITVNVTAGTFNNAFVNVSVVDAIHPNNYSLQNYISRYWNVKQTGITDAKATITASYIAAENLFPQTSMAAGQLDGTFNIQTNPWKKVGTLAGTTLTAEDVSLTNEQTSVFTGIKGGDFTAVINGADTYCSNEVNNLSTTVTGGDAPYLYAWSNGLGDQSTATLPSAPGTLTYSVTVLDANGFKTTPTKPVTINQAAIAGMISANQTVCFSYAPQPISVTGNTAVLYWERSENPSFTNPVRIQNTNTTLTGEEAGEIIGTTYFRAAFANGSCSPVYSTALIMDTESTEFGAAGWSNGDPSITKAAIISKDITLTDTLIACNLIVTNNAKVLVPKGMDVLLNASVIVDKGSTLTFESNTNLVQTANEPNFGVANIQRESSKLYRLDYTMWGSPMEPSQTLKQFSPLTVSNRFYIYNSSTDLFNTISPTTTGFTPGKGYLIRMPDNHIAYGAGIAQSWTGTFTGTPTNGNVSIALDPAGQGFNMIANPYASMVNAKEFLNTNSSEIDGTLYFWRRRNNIPDASAYYATYTLAGGTASASSAVPNGFIQVGQGFIVKKATTAPVTRKALFTNAMRTSLNNDNQIFKNNASDERNRIWLNVSNTAGEFGQTLLAYMPSATNELDRTDGKYLGDGSTALTSWLNDTRYIIQGRAPFSSSDVVPLNFETVSAGNYTIAIDHVDGLFEGNQNIYLRDKFHSLTHNLKNASYTFETAPGSFNSRFEIIYESGTLVVDNPEFTSNKVVVYKKDGDLVVMAKGTILDNVEVFDFAGRLLATAKNIKSDEVALKINSVNQVLIVKITSTTGKVVSKKFIN